MKIIIIMLVFLSLFLINVNAPGDDVAPDRFVINGCIEDGGACFYGHELYNGQCPDNLPQKRGGDEGERLCNEYDEGAEEVICCLPREGNGRGGNNDDREILLYARNAGTAEIGVNGEEPCCVQEGFVPEE